MNIPAWLPIAAFIISVCSLLLATAAFGHTVHRSYQDSPRLKAVSKFFEPSEYSPHPRMQVLIVNSGRRPAILMLLGTQFGERWVGSYLGKKEHGHRLGESERWETTLEPYGEHMTLPGQVDDGSEPTDLWFEDSLGRRYPVKDAAKNLARLYGRK